MGEAICLPIDSEKTESLNVLMFQLFLLDLMLSNIHLFALLHYKLFFHIFHLILYFLIILFSFIFTFFYIQGAENEASFRIHAN